MLPIQSVPVRSSSSARTVLAMFGILSKCPLSRVPVRRYCSPETVPTHTVPSFGGFHDRLRAAGAAVPFEMIFPAVAPCAASGPLTRPPRGCRRDPREWREPPVWARAPLHRCDSACRHPGGTVHHRCPPTACRHGFRPRRVRRSRWSNLGLHRRSGMCHRDIATGHGRHPFPPQRLPSRPTVRQKNAVLAKCRSGCRGRTIRIRRRRIAPARRLCRSKGSYRVSARRLERYFPEARPASAKPAACIRQVGLRGVAADKSKALRRHDQRYGAQGNHCDSLTHCNTSAIRRSCQRRSPAAASHCRA